MQRFPRKCIQGGCNKQEAEQDVLFTGNRFRLANQIRLLLSITTEGRFLLG